jgi:hypothetical protein
VTDARRVDEQAIGEKLEALLEDPNAGRNLAAVALSP